MENNFDWSKGARDILICSKPRTYIRVPLSLSDDEVEKVKRRYINDDNELHFNGMNSYLT